MAVADLAVVAAISAAVHGDYAESLEVYAERLRLYPAGCFAFADGDTVSGFLISHPWHGAPPALGAMLGALPIEPDSFYLHDIALLPAARGSGAGEAAVRLVEGCARAAGCGDISLVAVNGAERYWTRRGFVIAGDGGYGPGTYRMRKTL